MKRMMKLSRVAVLCAIMAFVMLVSSVPAYAATSGGWSVSKAKYSFLNSGQKKTFDKSVKKLTGVNYSPVALLAEQTVAGTNYVFLCQGTPVTAKASKSWYVLTASKSLKNKYSVRSTNKINVAKIKTNKNLRKGNLDGGLKIVGVKNQESALSKDVKKVFDKGTEKYVGCELRPIALLGTQVVAGKNYRFLCYAKAKGISDVVVVDIYENIKGTCKVTSCKSFNLEKYVD